MTYWDTSALIKLYAPEPDSPTFLDLLAQATRPPLTADITRAEMLCALWRKEHAGDLVPGAAETLFTRFLSDAAAGRLVIVPNGPQVTDEAQRLVKAAYTQPEPLLLRSLDTLHLASALAAAATTVVATDKRLRAAATLMELEVLP